MTEKTILKSENNAPSDNLNQETLEKISVGATVIGTAFIVDKTGGYVSKAQLPDWARDARPLVPDDKNRVYPGGNKDFDEGAGGGVGTTLGKKAVEGAVAGSEPRIDAGFAPDEKVRGPEPATRKPGGERPQPPSYPKLHEHPTPNPPEHKGGGHKN